MTRKIVEGIKDINGAFVRPEPPQNRPLSLDEILKESMINLQRIVEKISVETSKPGVPSRETVQSLKDCTLLILELKKKEQEILEEMSIDDLKKLVKKV